MDLRAVVGGSVQEKVGERKRVCVGLVEDTLTLGFLPRASRYALVVQFGALEFSDTL